jgi:hypothetical protein
MGGSISTCNLFIVIFWLASFSVRAQSGKDMTEADSLYYGTWKGTSICQVKNSPCHDETVVYHIGKSVKQNLIEVKANKIVNGAEVEMGIIEFRFDATTKEIISVSQPDAVWKFQKHNNSMAGTLKYKGELFRIIQLAKQD